MPKPSKSTPRAQAYTHDDAKRLNIPEAGQVDYIPKVKERAKDYCWDPRESPQLVWAGKAGLKKVEVDEETSLEVPLVNLHIHERVSTEAILRSAKREDAQRSLFADPEMDFKDEVKFYQHPVDWSNRMILGDSLAVMTSLAEREGLRGKVQCIYLDPPYGIDFRSNFQPLIDQTRVRDGVDDDLTREVMQVQAYRDTWVLEVHSYLTYLRDRLFVARELLADTGFIFVQIGDANVHRVRVLLDEVFRPENCCGQIAFATTSGLPTNFLASQYDYLLWFAKDKDGCRKKFRKVFVPKSALDEDDEEESGTAANYGWLELENGSRRGMSKQERATAGSIPAGAQVYKPDNITSQGNPTVRFVHHGKEYSKPWKPSLDGMRRLSVANRIHVAKDSLQYVRYLRDFGYRPVTLQWNDTQTGNFNEEKRAAVRTAEKVIERCARILKPGGLAIFFEPFEGGFDIVGRIYKDAYRNPRSWLLGPRAYFYFRNCVRYWKQMRSADKSDPFFVGADDKWLFTQAFFENLQKDLGFRSCDMYALDKSAKPFETLIRTHLEGNRIKTPPRWFWDIVDRYENAFSDEQKRGLFTEGCIVIRK